MLKFIETIIALAFLAVAVVLIGVTIKLLQRDGLSLFSEITYCTITLYVSYVLTFASIDLLRQCFGGKGQ